MFCDASHHLEHILRKPLVLPLSKPLLLPLSKWHLPHILQPVTCTRGRHMKDGQDNMPPHSSGAGQQLVLNQVVSPKQYTADAPAKPQLTLVTQNPMFHALHDMWFVTADSRNSEPYVPRSPRHVVCNSESYVPRCPRHLHS
jgi:hypothetical protein